MNNQKTFPIRRYRLTCVVCGLIIISMLLSSCQPLRKKFIREKKKGEEEEVIPILDPIDYEADYYTVQRIYSYHFSMWLAWQKDMLVALTEDASDKRKRYLIDQLILQVDIMRSKLSGNKEEGLRKILSKLKKMKKELHTPLLLRNEFAMQKDLKSIARTLRAEYKVEEVRGSFKTK